MLTERQRQWRMNCASEVLSREGMEIIYTARSPHNPIGQAAIDFYCIDEDDNLVRIRYDIEKEAYTSEKRIKRIPDDFLYASKYAGAFAASYLTCMGIARLMGVHEPVGFLAGTWLYTSFVKNIGIPELDGEYNNRTFAWHEYQKLLKDRPAQADSSQPFILQGP